MVKIRFYCYDAILAFNYSQLFLWCRKGSKYLGGMGVTTMASSATYSTGPLLPGCCSIVKL